MRFVDCDFEGVDLSELDLAGCVFDQCLVRQTKLNGAKLEASRWTGCRGAFAGFGGASLTDAAFRACDLNNASFRGAFMSSVGFSRCKLTGCDLSEVRTLGTIFEETLLVAAKLPSFSFRKMVLDRVDFSQADLRKADFRHAVFKGCSLHEADTADARFEGANLRGAAGGSPKRGRWSPAP